MLCFKNLVITQTIEEDGYWSEKSKKRIKYKKPKVTTKVIHAEEYIGDLSDLYDTIKFFTEKYGIYRPLDVKVEPYIEF